MVGREGNSEEMCLGEVKNAEGVENTVGGGAPSGWGTQVLLGNLERGAGSSGAQARGQCSWLLEEG